MTSSAIASLGVVERLIGRLKEWRAIATRYEKLAASFVAVILLGFIRIWLHDLLAYSPYQITLTAFDQDGAAKSTASGDEIL